VLNDDLVIDLQYLGDAYGEDLPDGMLDLIDAGKPTLSVLSDWLANDTAPVNTLALNR